VPDGWLGPLCLNKLYYDFSAEKEWNDDEWSKLHDKLIELIHSGCLTLVLRFYFYAYCKLQFYTP